MTNRSHVIRTCCYCLNFFTFLGQVDKNHSVYTDDQLEAVLEQALKHTDLNNDGYVDYSEYRFNDYKAKKARQSIEKA